MLTDTASNIRRLRTTYLCDPYNHEELRAKNNCIIIYKHFYIVMYKLIILTTTEAIGRSNISTPHVARAMLAESRAAPRAGGGEGERRSESMGE